jgi:hypothetical protein
MEELAHAALTAQGTFSTMAGESPAERSRRVDEFLSNALEAQTLAGNESIGQHTLLAGLVSRLGGSEDQQRATRLGIAHLTELGAIEETGVVQQGMPALMGQVGAALGALPANATAEQRTRAGHQALIQGVAEMEVMRGAAGYSANASGNIFSNMGTALSSDVTQQRILNNVNHARMSEADRARVRDALFQTDAHGHSSLRGNLATDPVQFAAEAARVLRNDPTAFQNLFAGGGHGNAQSLQANWRRLGARMFTADETGETGYERIKRFARASAEGISAEDMQRRENLTTADPMTRFIQQEETRLNALTSNTSSILQLSHSLDQFRAEHPLLASAASKAGGVAAEVVAMNHVDAATGYSGSTQRSAIWGAIKRGEYNPFNTASPENEAERITTGRALTARKSADNSPLGREKAQWTPEEYARRMVAAFEQGVHLTVDPVAATHAATTAAAQPPR